MNAWLAESLCRKIKSEFELFVIHRLPVIIKKTRKHPCAIYLIHERYDKNTHTDEMKIILQ